MSTEMPPNRSGGSKIAPERSARKGARYRPTILAGGHQSASVAINAGTPGTAELRPRIERCSTREDQASQNGLKGLGRDIGSGEAGDLLGRRVGLLCRKSTLLDRKGSRVACGEDVLDAGHVTAAVRDDEALRVARDALDPGALQARQSDYVVGFEFPFGREREQPVVELDRVGARANTDSALCEQFRDRRRAAWPKISSGASSCVTTTTSTLGSRIAVWRASSYSGSGQLTPPGTAKTTRLASSSPSSPSREPKALLSAGPRKVKAPGMDSTGRAPTAISKAS